EMFGSRDVVRGAAVKIAAGQLALIELDELARREAFADDPVALGLRSVTVADGVGGRQRGYLLHPLLDRRMLNLHPLVSSNLCRLCHDGLQIAACGKAPILLRRWPATIS